MRPFRDVLVVAADGDEYIGNAGRYLLFRVDGTYTPQTTVFDLEGMMRAWIELQEQAAKPAEKKA